MDIRDQVRAHLSDWLGWAGWRVVIATWDSRRTTRCAERWYNGASHGRRRDWRKPRSAMARRTADPDRSGDTTEVSIQRR